MTKKRDAEKWADENFGAADFHDDRLTKRVVKVAGDLAGMIGASLSRASGDDDAAAEGAYRMARNKRVLPSAIALSGFSATVAKAAQLSDPLLAIEDTTELSYHHETAMELGDLGGPSGSKARGFLVHSSLLLNARTGETVGLMDQEYWTRETEARGKRHLRKKRPYEEKESFKWRRTSERLRERLGDEMMTRVITAGDRESDVYEYLSYKVEHHERFVTRASWDRNVEIDAQAAPETIVDKHLFAVLHRARLYGTASVYVPQRGGRPAREATLSLRALRIRLKRPTDLSAKVAPPRIGINAVLACEESPPPGVEPLEWLLFTSEPIGTDDNVLDVLRLYRLRWRIEDFHKAWKSGAGVERRRMQTPQNIQRIAVLLAFVAVRLLQLRERHEQRPDARCDEVLSAKEWKVLWVAIEKRKPPAQAPTAEWAYRAIARLGGWRKWRGNARVGWDSYWIGWRRLQERVEGYEAAVVLGRRL